MEGGWIVKKLLFKLNSCQKPLSVSDQTWETEQATAGKPWKKSPGFAEILKVSSVYETGPVGNVDQPDFINCAAEIKPPPLRSFSTDA
jgi:hypothetical protein